MSDYMVDGSGVLENPFKAEGYYYGAILIVLAILIVGALYWYYYVRKPAAAAAAPKEGLCGSGACSREGMAGRQFGVEPRTLEIRK
jgi:hypothetical protein